VEACCRLLAAAKVNLSLHVPGRRADGYHQLEGLVAFADFGDELLVNSVTEEGATEEGVPEQPLEQVSEQGSKANAGWSISLAGPFAAGLEREGPADNLIIKAAKLFHQAGGGLRGAHFHLVKNLPVASGIGGGSADAAAALRALQQLGPTPLAEEDLQALALKLGADVPMCLAQKAQYVQGVGEISTPVAVAPKLPAILVNPGVKLSTGAVFRALNAPLLAPDFAVGEAKSGLPPPDAPPDALLDGLIDWLSRQQNDLQPPAISEAPVIIDVLAAIERADDCLLSRMSGSGATCFGLFPSQNAAHAAARRIARDHPAWWCVDTMLG